MLVPRHSVSVIQEQQKRNLEQNLLSAENLTLAEQPKERCYQPTTSGLAHKATREKNRTLKRLPREKQIPRKRQMTTGNVSLKQLPQLDDPNAEGIEALPPPVQDYCWSNLAGNIDRGTAVCRPGLEAGYLEVLPPAILSGRRVRP